jgi:ParB family chromosome partitioning protein
MKLEAMKHQAGRPSKENYSQVGNNSGKTSSQEMAEELGISKNQIFRFIRLTELIPEIRDMVDEKKIAFNPAVELSYLKPEEQKEFLEAMDYAQTSPSLSQAQRIKRMSQEGQCTLEQMCDVMNELKKDDMTTVTISHDVLRKYFPRSYTPQQMQDVIVKLLDQWQKKRNRDQSR